MKIWGSFRTDFINIREAHGKSNINPKNPYFTRKNGIFQTKILPQICSKIGLLLQTPKTLNI